MAYTKYPKGRSKPKVVSCRLDQRTYEKLTRYLEETDQTKQAFLEKLITFALSLTEKSPSKFISKRTKEKLEELKSQGYWVGRIPELFEAEKVNGHVKLRPSKTLLFARALKNKGCTYREISAILERELGERVPHIRIWRSLKLLEKLEAEDNRGKNRNENDNHNREF